MLYFSFLFILEIKMKQKKKRALDLNVLATLRSEQRQITFSTGGGRGLSPGSGLVVFYCRRHLVYFCPLALSPSPCLECRTDTEHGDPAPSLHCCSHSSCSAPWVLPTRVTCAPQAPTLSVLPFSENSRLLISIEELPGFWLGS